MRCKQKIIVLGPKGSGKDTFANAAFGDQWLGSSWHACELFINRIMSDILGCGYLDTHDCYADRDNNRTLWKQLISAYNKGDAARMARDMYCITDVYVGCRDEKEFFAIQAEFDPLVIWINRPGYRNDETMDIPYGVRHFVVENEGTEVNFTDKAQRIGKTLGFSQIPTELMGQDGPTL